MAKNKISDVVDHLFMRLERLGDEDLKGDELQEEISRAKAVSETAQAILSAGELVLRARIAADNTLTGSKILPSMFE